MKSIIAVLLIGTALIGYTTISGFFGDKETGHCSCDNIKDMIKWAEGEKSCVSALFISIELILIKINLKNNMIKQKVLVSYTSKPHSSSSFALHNIKNDSRSTDQEEADNDNDDTWNLVETGLTSGWTKIAAYLNLIKETKCWNLTNEEIITNYETILFGVSAYNSEEQQIKYSYSKWIQDINPIMKRKIIEMYKDKFSISTISSLFRIDKL